MGCRLYNDAVKTADIKCKTENVAQMYVEVRGMGEEMAMAYFVVLPHICLNGTQIQITEPRWKFKLCTSQIQY